MLFKIHIIINVFLYQNVNGNIIDLFGFLLEYDVLAQVFQHQIGLLFGTLGNQTVNDAFLQEIDILVEQVIANQTDAFHMVLVQIVGNAIDLGIESNHRLDVVLTDGYWDDQTTEEHAASSAIKDGILIYGIGIGGADESFLQKISSGKGKKVDLSQLTATFKEVASSIATEISGKTWR